MVYLCLRGSKRGILPLFIRSVWFLRLWGEHSAGGSKLYRHCSTTKAFIYYALTLTGTKPHILAPTNFTSQPLAPLVSFHKSAETGSQLGCENHKKWSRASAPHFFFLNLIFFPCISANSQNNAAFALLPAETATGTYHKVVLPCSYCLQLLIPEHPVFPTACITPGSAVLWSSLICASFSPLCCVVLPASPSFPYHLQWKSSGLIPVPVGFPSL